jgi:hypothetical protein
MGLESVEERCIGARAMVMLSAQRDGSGVYLSFHVSNFWLRKAEAGASA